MKKAIAAILAVLVLVLTASCGAAPKIGEVEQSPETLVQMQLISTFGTTQKDRRIVASDDENEYVKYVVLEYENGKKTSEKTYYFYNNDTSFALAKKNYADNEAITFCDEGRYTVENTSDFNFDSYDEDYMSLGKNYIFR